MNDLVSAGNRSGPPSPPVSDRIATLLGCGCLLVFVATDLAVTAFLVYLLFHLDLFG